MPKISIRVIWEIPWEPSIGAQAKEFVPNIIFKELFPKRFNIFTISKSFRGRLTTSTNGILRHTSVMSFEVCEKSNMSNFTKKELVGKPTYEYMFD